MSASRRILNKSLKDQLVELIRIKGPLTVNEYMKIVLTNPASGFYMNEDVFGVKGHFTTSPEISQMFGELLGAWVVQEWRRFGRPKPLRLVELGPGRATLMSDIIRTINHIEKAPNSIQIRLVEVSPKLQDVQRRTLVEHAKNLYDEIQWHSQLATMEDCDAPEGFTAFIAHEYLDALPVHKFVRDMRTGQWRELMIDYNKNQDLVFCIGRHPTLSARLLVPEKFTGDHIEVCPEAALQLERASKWLNAAGRGCMLVCDYGFEEEPHCDACQQVPALKPARASRDTFRAFKNHESWPPLKNPGEADLTADVDFGFLKRHLENKALVFGSVMQKEFLLKCGLQQRLDSLLSQASEEQRNELVSGANIITNDMGERYRFLSIFPKGSNHLFVNDPPAGFC